MSFRGCTSLIEIPFLSNSHVATIDGFCECASLCRIEIPSSVEIIDVSGFHGWISLNEIMFSADSHVKKMDGFQGCTSLCRIELLSSSEIVYGFGGCFRLRVVNMRRGYRVRDTAGLRTLRLFFVHDDQDVNDRRRLFHLGLLCSK
jgi:hypothetical protein